MGKILHNLIILALTALCVWGSFMYESAYSVTEAKIRENQVAVTSDERLSLVVNRGGENYNIKSGGVFEVGDIFANSELDITTIEFSGDGELRLGPDTRVLLAYQDVENSEFVFKLIEGEVWLNNMFSNAKVNIMVEGAVVDPGQSIIYVKVDDDKAKVYANTNNADIYFVSQDYAPDSAITDVDDSILNSLLIPQGREVTVFASKVANNESVIARLLFSKLIKEFQYLVFDKDQLRNNAWFADNISQDQQHAIVVKNQRLKRIRDRGLQYESLDSFNYQLDQYLLQAYNLLTFSDERVGMRILASLYDLLYDSQYLFDLGKLDEGRQRLTSFKTNADRIFLEYGEELKSDYDAKIYQEIEYLSFINPNDSLFELKEVLIDIYLNSIGGTEEEMRSQFRFLQEDLNALNFYAENRNFNLIKVVYQEYMEDLKEVLEMHSDQLQQNVVLIQQQNQILDNLFAQYAQLYRTDFFTSKLFIENEYLKLLPEGLDKYEEIQTMINQRIYFLKLLQKYFLEEEVPLSDAQNIITLLMLQIEELQLPREYQVGISQLFNTRLKDFAVFNVYLYSPEYVSSSQKGKNQQERFAAFKKERASSLDIDDVRSQISSMGGAVQADSSVGSIPEPQPEEPEEPEEPETTIDEERVIMDVNGEVTEVDTGVDEPVRMPRVRR